MADPNHVAQLDRLDIWSVCFYRVGLSAIALGLAWAAWLEISPAQIGVGFGWLFVAGGAALAAANVHLYAKLIRWLLQMATGAGLLMLLIAVMVPLSHEGGVFSGGLALLFVSVCGFALKEQYCFHLYGMWLLPLLLGAALMPMSGDQAWIGALALACAAVIYAYLAVAKWRMPLHFDIGDKSKYQI
jgi:uncharacterized integral membrane protein